MQPVQSIVHPTDFLAPTNRLLKTNEAALVCGLAESTLEKRRLNGGGPKFVKFGRAVRYRMEDLIEFAKDNIFSSTSEYGRAMVH